MAHLLDDVIDVISRPPAARSDADINGILPWLRRRTELMPQLDQDTIIEILRQCSYQTAERDDVLLRQGEEGESMYIILRGSISVYIDASLTGEETGDAYISPTVSPSRESPDNRRYRHLDRAHYGRFIIKYDSGKHFGEAALVGEDKTRNATILADEDCDLLVIYQDLFDRCLKEHQLKELQIMQNFVEHHPLFKHMSLKFKRLLELSLRRQNFAFETPIVTQGDAHKSLYFILSGQANIMIEPGKHQNQYKHLWPFEIGTDIYAQEFEWLRESRRTAIMRQYEDLAVWQTKPDSLIVKRTEGYAASERLMHDRTVCMCSVQKGEVVGDAELVFNLSTYMQSVVCTANTQTLVLDVKNLERVTGRRNTLTLQLMNDQVVEKLASRQRSQHGLRVPFLSFMYAKLTEVELPERKPLPALKTGKSLPNKELQTQHMLDRYLQGKAELLEPCVPGSLIYKDIMEEKARIRANIRRRGNMGVQAMLREARRKMNRRKPRSRREIVDSLKEMIEAELVEPNLEGPRQHQKQQKDTTVLPAAQQFNAADALRRSSLSMGGEEHTARRSSLVGDGATPRRPSLTGADVTPRRLSLTGDDQTPRRGSLTGELDTPRRLSLTGEGGTPGRSPLLPKESPRNVSDLARKSSLTKDNSIKDLNAKKRVKLPPLEIKKSKPEGSSANTGLKSGSKAGPETPKNRASSRVDPTMPQILEEREEATLTRDSDSTPSPALSSSKGRYVKREVQASSDGHTPPSGSAKRLPPLAKVELRRPEHVPNERWTAALKFVNERMHDRFTEQLLSQDNPGLNDYETSEGSLQLLESRIKQFHVKHGEFSPVRLNLKLPKLRRFKLDLEDETQRLPKPGGKVWIKKRLCQIANSKFKVKGHEHIRYHMVPELPEFDQVKKMQTVMQQLMDNSVLKRQGEDRAEGNAKTIDYKSTDLSHLNEHRASFV